MLLRSQRAWRYLGELLSGQRLLKSRFFLCLFGFLFVVSLAHGQRLLGLRAGGNFSYLYASDPYRTLFFKDRAFLSPQIAGVYRHYLTARAAFQVGVGWSRRAYVEEFSVTNAVSSSAEVISRMTYVESPFTTVLAWDFSNFGLSLEGGVFYRYLVQRQNEQRGVLPPDTGENLWKLPDERYNKHGYGVHGGGGLSYRHAVGVLQMTLRVNFPLVQHIRTERLYQQTPYESRLVSYDLSMLCLFYLPKKLPPASKTAISP